VKLAAVAVVGALVLQWLIGMNLIWQGFPLWLGTSHNAGAAILLLATLTLIRYLWPARLPAAARVPGAGRAAATDAVSSPAATPRAA
jgi:heme A synthase